MEKKLLLQEIADFIAAKEGISKKKAETFSRLFFETIEEGLVNDKYVKIKGFGTFKLVPVSERESVNINTGERIQISGHSKISFTPDTLIKDLVNKPFSHFQTVIINEDTDIEELERVETPEETEENYEEEVISSDASDEVSETEVTSSEEDSSEKSDETEKQVQPAIPIVVSPTLEDETEKEFADDEPNTSEEEAQTNEEDDSKTVDATTTETATEVVEEITAEETSEETEKSEDTDNEVYASNEENLVAEEKDQEEVTTEEETSAEEEISTEEKDEEEAETEEVLSSSASQCSPTDGKVNYIPEEKPHRRGHNWWKIITATLFVLFLMGMSYFSGYFKVFCPPCEEVKTVIHTNKPASPAQKTVKDSIKASTAPPDSMAVPAKRDSIKEKPTPVVQAPDEKEETKLDPSVPYVITGTRSTHIMKSGETIYRIARRYYGHNDFAPYIIKYNDLKDPDNVNVGTFINLPELTPAKD